MKPLILTFILIFHVISHLLAQEALVPEVQISFANENKPLDYYVKQAELWWKEVEKDKTSEISWYNYYRACRNAQGTANWNTDFVKKTPYLKLGDDIVDLMEKNIPDSFTYNFVKGSTGGVSAEGGEYLLKAYKMNPNFEGLLADVVTYAVSTHNSALRQEANEKWLLNNGISNELLTFGYNLLNSVEPGSIILTEHDNDTYPAWMLQDAKHIRNDVLIINIDFFLYGNFREKVFEELGIKAFELNHVDVNEYEQNWERVVKHFLNNYKGDRPIYISNTVSPKYYVGFEDQLYPSGLAKKYSKKKVDLTKRNINLIENVFLLDSLKVQLTKNMSQDRIDEINLNYLESFKIAYDSYTKSANTTSANKIQSLALALTNRVKDPALKEKYEARFGK
jgi:hypothetical protein